MDTINILIMLSVIMWLLQIILGWRQVTSFNKAFVEISNKGKILIGRNNGRFTPKSIVVLAIDAKGIVIDSLFMKGFSVFAHPQKLNAVLGLKVEDIYPKDIFPRDKKSQFALSVAISAFHQN